MPGRCEHSDAGLEAAAGLHNAGLVQFWARALPIADCVCFRYTVHKAMEYGVDVKMITGTPSTGVTRFLTASHLSSAPHAACC